MQEIFEILHAIIQTFDKNQYFKNLNESMENKQANIPVEVQQQIQQMQQELEESNRTNEELQKQLQQAQCELLANRQSNEVALKTKEMELQTDMMKFRMELEYKYGKLNQETQTKIVTEQMKQNSETTRQELKANENMKQEILNMAKEGLNDSI